MTVSKEQEKILAFVSFCIEEYKTRHGSDGKTVALLFDKYKVMDYLMEHYEILHTFSKDAIMDDIEQFINIRKGKE